MQKSTEPLVRTMTPMVPRNYEDILERTYAPGRSPSGQILTTRVGLRLPDNLTYEEWERAGVKLFRIADTSAWCLGDWLAHGQDKYGGKYRFAIERFGLDYQTLRNYAWIARKFELGRRREALSLQHHAEVASLATDEQEHWLNRAEQGKWSRNQLRKKIRDVYRNGTARAVGVTIPRLMVPQEHLERWRRAAEQSSNSLETWLVSTLNQAATTILETDRDGEAGT